MIKNYFKIAFRNLAKHKVYSAINVAGLAAGIAACLLIFVVVKFELSYNTYQKNYNRIYRVVTDTKNGDGSMAYNPGVPAPALDALKTDFPQFEKIVAVNAAGGNQVTILGDNPNAAVSTGKKIIEDNGIVFTQPAYFDIFDSKWLSGSPLSLSEPGNVVLSKSIAGKYFGDWKNATGKFLKLDNTLLLTVSGVVEDAPSNSDFPLKIFIAHDILKQYGDKYGYNKEWGSLSSNYQVYALLPANINIASLQPQLNSFNKKYYPVHEGQRFNKFQPLSDMHFNHRYGTMGDHSSSKTILLTLALIGVLIIVMASINFINLSTAQAVGRSREVGIRKVLGSSRAQLLVQSMGETFLIVLFAVLLAAAIGSISMPYLSNVASVPADVKLFTTTSILFLVIVLVLVTFLSGIYPAMIVSGFKPALALKSKITSASIGGISLRRILVVTQFSIAQMLLIATIVAVSQMNFVRNADLGFNKDAVLILPAYSDSAAIGRMQPLKQQLLQNPDVINVSFASDEASSDNNWASNFAFDHRKDENYPVFFKYADEDYMKTFGLQLLAGRWYAPSDTTREIVVNETLLKKVGLLNPQQAIGKVMRVGAGGWRPIVGVVKDFKANSLREEVKPLAIMSRRKDYYTVAIKLRLSDLSKTTAQVQKLWEQTYPEYAYTSHFSDETIQRFYKQETQLSLLYKIFAGIAIFISCLGLYGLVSYMAVQKTKEVGVRKVLGATVGNIVVMFSKEFTLLISIAFIIAVPVAWYFMNEWLQNFIYRIHMGVGVFLLAISLSLFIAWITVGYRAIKAALANPVKSLRTE